MGVFGGTLLVPFPGGKTWPFKFVRGVDGSGSGVAEKVWLDIVDEPANGKLNPCWSDSCLEGEEGEDAEATAHDRFRHYLPREPKPWGHAPVIFPV